MKNLLNTYWLCELLLIYQLGSVLVSAADKKLEDDDEAVFNCFTTLGCHHDGKDDIMACLDDVESQEARDVVDRVMAESAPEDFQASEAFNLYNHYCDLEEEQQKSVFSNLISGLIEEYSDACHSEEEHDSCDDYKNLFECVMALMEDFADEGLCDL